MYVLPNHKWLERLDDPTLLRIAYNAGRDYVEDETGKESSACATVHSVLLWARGVTDKIHMNTAQVEQALIAAGASKFDGWQSVQRGDSLFAEDNGGMIMSDHVYMAMGSPDLSTGDCLVMDNYKSKPHMRNLTTGKYTPFWYGYRFVEPPVKPLSLIHRMWAKWGFVWLYRAFGVYPPYIQREVNMLRHDKYFSNL